MRIGLFDSQPSAGMVATVRMVWEFVFVQIHVNATVDERDQVVIYVRFLYVFLLSASIQSC